MTREDYWLDAMARIGCEAPLDLDAEAPSAPVPQTDAASAPARAPSTLLWPKANEGWSFIGVRVTELPDDPAHLASRLAAAAIERNVVPILLTSLPRSGFERFGFRTERLRDPADPDASQVEAELAAFWDLAIIIDLAEVLRLG